MHVKINLLYAFFVLRDDFSERINRVIRGFAVFEVHPPAIVRRWHPGGCSVRVNGEVSQRLGAGNLVTITRTDSTSVWYSLDYYSRQIFYKGFK
jgi:hypothetical protein